jgi:hypothetical protein
MPEPNPQQHHTTPWVILGAVLITLAVFMLFSGSPSRLDFLKYAYTPSSGGQPAQQSNNGAQISIDFGNGKIRAFKGGVETGMTIISALRIAGEVGRFDAVTDDRGQVVDIDGFKNDGTKHWGVYVNSQPISDLPGHIELKAGDRITLRYE